MKDLRKQIVDLTGEEPEDILGPDWEEYAEDYLEDERERMFADKFWKE
ncbi:hypothetical protein [Sulfuricurvum sp.]